MIKIKFSLSILSVLTERCFIDSGIIIPTKRRDGMREGGIRGVGIKEGGFEGIILCLA
jgi:hypothetical protein